MFSICASIHTEARINIVFHPMVHFLFSLSVFRLHVNFSLASGFTSQLTLSHCCWKRKFTNDLKPNSRLGRRHQWRTQSSLYFFCICIFFRAFFGLLRSQGPLPFFFAVERCYVMTLTLFLHNFPMTQGGLFMCPQATCHWHPRHTESGLNDVGWMMLVIIQPREGVARPEDAKCRARACREQALLWDLFLWTALYLARGTGDNAG